MKREPAPDKCPTCGLPQAVMELDDRYECCVCGAKLYYKDIDSIIEKHQADNRNR